MKNQECYDKEGNFLGWFSRSVAVVAIIVLDEGFGEYSVLVSRRGPGTPDAEFVGKWNLCCGYLDFDESGAEAAAREIYEETGVMVKPEDCVFLSAETDPKTDKRQNVSLRYGVLLKGDREYYEKQFSHENNEAGEVGEIRFVSVTGGETEQIEWAFNHKELVDTNFAQVASLG